jgi:hypothetical protein
MRCTRWIYARCREVEASPDDYLDLWARFHYKSTVITFAGAIQEIITDPDVTAAIFSHTRPDALKPHRQIKHELETNEILKTAFPDIMWADPQKEAPRWAEETGLVVKRKSNPKESTLEAWGLVDGQPTSAHYKLRIYNDVVAPESVTTPDQIQKTTAAWELSDNLGAVGGRKWHEGTRYSFADTYQAILEKGALIARIYPATDNGRVDGTPVLLTAEQWAEKKIVQGPAVIACQQLQNPIAGQQALFDAHGPAPVRDPAGDAECLHHRGPCEVHEEGLGEHGHCGSRHRRRPQQVSAGRLQPPHGPEDAVGDPEGHPYILDEPARGAGGACGL